MKTLVLAIPAILIVSVLFLITSNANAQQISCPHQIEMPIQNSSYVERAISIASNDSNFKADAGGNATFYALYNTWHFNSDKCNNFVWQEVNVVFKDGTKDGHPHYVIPAEDPALTAVLYILDLDSDSPPHFDKNIFRTEGGNETSILSHYVANGLPKLIASPFKQTRAGIWWYDVQCNSGLEFLVKVDVHSPACVKPSSVSRLVLQGWSTYEQNFRYDTYSWCPNTKITINENKILLRCNHEDNLSKTAFDLQPPVYELYACKSTYGCSSEYGWTGQDNPSLLSEEQKQNVLSMVMDLQGIKSNPDWQVDHFITYPRADRWFADIQLFLSQGNGVNQTKTCSKYAQVGIDLQTLEVMYDVNTNQTSNVGCNVK